MKLDVLKALHSTIPREQLCEAYEAATGEKINLELVDQLIKPKKKQSILTIEKELLSSYMEAVADMKRLKEIFAKFEVCQEDQDFINNTFDPIINKHVERIKGSGIWE
jgi:hypothetical protein